MFNSKNSRRFVLLVVVGILVACLAGYVQAKPITLIYNQYLPPSYPQYVKADKAFVDYVNEHGGERVKIEYYNSGTLLSGSEQLAGLAAGTADIIYKGYGTPVVDYYDLPFLFTDDKAFNESKICHEINELTNRILEQKYGYKILGDEQGVALTNYFLFTKDKQITKLEDLKGLVIRVSTKGQGKWVNAIGASPEFMPSSELYLALQRGVLDGALLCWSTIIGRSCHEICKNGVTTPAVYGTSCFMLMMADRYNNLPEDVQKILLEAQARWRQVLTAEFLKDDKISFLKAKEAGMIFNEWPPEVVEECKKIAEPIWEEWAKQYGDEGSKLIELGQEVQ